MTELFHSVLLWILVSKGPVPDGAQLSICEGVDGDVECEPYDPKDCVLIYGRGLVCPKMFEMEFVVRKDDVLWTYDWCSRKTYGVIRLATGELIGPPRVPTRKCIRIWEFETPWAR